MPGGRLTVAGPPVAELAASLLDQMLPMLRAAGHIVVASDADVGGAIPSIGISTRP